MTDQTERERVVAWLREQAKAGEDVASGHGRMTEAYAGAIVALENAADSIEAGDHLKGTTDD